MMEGRMRKFYEETVLLQQTYAMDNETQVGKVIEKAAKELGAPITVEGFVRFQVGEGIEKAEADFADEVAQMAGTR
jgi:elongation factor Ts